MMAIIKRSILTTVLLLVTTNLYADANKHALVMEYLTLSKTKETLDTTIDTYAEQLSNQYPDANKESVSAFFNQYMGWEVLKTPLIQITADTFSVQELKDINRFYKTESGRSLAAKTPKLATDISSVIAANLQKTMQTIQQQNTVQSTK